MPQPLRAVDRLKRFLRREEPERPELTQQMIDGRGEHRRDCDWTLTQVRNSVFSAGYIKSQASKDYYLAESEAV